MTARTIAAHVIPPLWVLYKYEEDIYMLSCALLKNSWLCKDQQLGHRVEAETETLIFMPWHSRVGIVAFN